MTLKSLAFLAISPDWEKKVVDGYTAFRCKQDGLHILIASKGFEVLPEDRLPRGGTVSGFRVFTPWSEDERLYLALTDAK